MARTNSILSLKFTKMVLNRFIFLAVCLLFVSTFLFQAFSPVLANEEPIDKSVPEGTVFRVNVPESKVFIGNLTNENTSTAVGTSTLTGPQDNKKFSSTTVTGSNDKDSNFVIARTGTSGQLRVGVFGSNQHVLIDQSALLPRNKFDIDDKKHPVIQYDKAYTKDSVIKFNYGSANAGRSAIINLEASAGTGNFVAYPCAEVKPTKTSITATTSRKQTSADIVKIGSDGNVCFTGTGSLANLKVTTLGYALFTVPTAQRKLNMRSTNPDTLTSTPKTIKTNAANALAFVHVTARTTSAGSISLYTTGRSSNNTTLMNPNGKETETAFGVVMTDANGKFTLSATKQASYTVDVATVPLSTLGVTASVIEQKRVLNSQNGYIGSDVKLTGHTQNFYSTNADLTITCKQYLNMFGWTSNIKIRLSGLDPELSPDNNNIDGGTATLRFNNIFESNPDGSDVEYVRSKNADTKGVVSTDEQVYFLADEKFKSDIWYGTLKIYTNQRYAVRSGSATYKLAVPCKRAN